MFQLKRNLRYNYLITILNLLAPRVPEIRTATKKLHIIILSDCNFSQEADVNVHKHFVVS